MKAHGYMDTAGSEQLVCNFENWAAVRKQTLLSAQISQEGEQVSLGRGVSGAGGTVTSFLLQMLLSS